MSHITATRTQIESVGNALGSGGVALYVESAGLVQQCILCTSYGTLGFVVADTYSEAEFCLYWTGAHKMTAMVLS